MLGSVSGFVSASVSDGAIEDGASLDGGVLTGLFVLPLLGVSVGHLLFFGE